jgi:hypothetical protein
MASNNPAKSVEGATGSSPLEPPLGKAETANTTANIATGRIIVFPH